MTASADIPTTAAISLEPVQVTDGAHMLLRGIYRMFGASLLLAAVGLWVAPGANWDSDLVLFKLALSVAAVFAGVCLMQPKPALRAPQAEIDTIRREVRIVRHRPRHAPIVVQSCAFQDLSKVERTGNHVRMYGKDEAVLAEVTLSKRSALNSLIAGLQDAGKLA